MTDREAFLAGERPETVQIYLHETVVSNPDALLDHGRRVADGIVLLLDGQRGRQTFQTATGIDPMAFAREAMDTDGEIDPDCAGGTCPADSAHETRMVFAFVEAENEAAGGLYVEGSVVHAYAACECGERYSQKWVAGTRPVPSD